MKKIIELTPKWTKWVFIINGAINSAIGINQLLQSDSISNWGSILGVILLIGGLLMIIYGVILFYPTNKLTPKVQLDESGILITEGIHKKQRKIDWANIKEITYKSFELNFLLNDRSIEIVNLQTNGETSIEIKRTLRQFANDRQIEIVSR